MAATGFQDVDVTVYELNDPNLVFLVSRLTAANILVPYPTGGRTWNFYLKPVAGGPDPAPISGTYDATQNTATQSAIVVALTKAQVGLPGFSRYHLDAVFLGATETVSAGAFTVLAT